MKLGVVYKFKLGKKINGTLFYCFEYFAFLRQFTDIKFYIVGIEQSDLTMIKRLFSEKYDTSVEGIVPVTATQLYAEKLDRTIILDVMSFYDLKEFLTGEVHCYSNDTHPMFRYKNDRSVTYYGSYDWQPRDVFSYLKLNFGIFKQYESESNAVFLSSVDVDYLRNNYHTYRKQFDVPVLLKQGSLGLGNILEQVNHVHYVHVVLDKNNRIIPEAIYYGKTVSIEDLAPEIKDSANLRYEDIISNGLEKYTLSLDDEIVKQCLR